MKKKFLALVLTLAMVLSLVPMTALATNGTEGGASQENTRDNLTMKKTVIPNEDGTYTVRLESYATGTVTPTQAPVPMDFVLVLDVSGSMDGENGKIASYGYQETRKTSWYINDIRYAHITYYAKIDEEYYPVSYQSEWVPGGYFGGHNEYWLEANGQPLGKKGGLTDKLYSGSLYTYGELPDSQMSKLKAMQTAVNHFIDSVAAQKNGNTPVAHRISIVKFAGNPSDKVSNDTYTEGWNTYNYTQKVKELTDVTVEGNVDSLKTAVNALNAGGATRADLGMEKADGVLNGRQDAEKDRPSVVIMFTDGKPTTSDGFEWNVAGAAVDTAKTLKAGGTKVYTIGMFTDADPSDTRGAFNKYMNGVSSKYPGAVGTKKNNNKDYNGIYLGTGVDGNYYFKADNAGDLDQVFQTISESTTVTSPLDDKAVVVDNVPSNFALTENSVKVYTANCIAKNGEEFTWGADTPAQEISSTPTKNQDGSQTISTTGFNFSGNWCGLDEKNQARGQKLIIEFTISRTNYGGTQPTNAGAYIKAKADDEKEIIKLADPQVPVTIELNKTLEVNEEKYYDGEGFAILTKIAAQANTLVDGINNAYVDMELTVKVDDTTGETTYTYKIPAGEKTGSWYEGDSEKPMDSGAIGNVKTSKDVKRSTSNEVEVYTYNFDLTLSDADTTPNGAKSKKYQDNNASFKIKPVSVTVKADDKQVTRGTAPNSIPYTATVTGLVNDEAESLISRTIQCESYTVDTPVTSAGSELAIIASGAEEQGNYTVTYQPGKLTVTAAPVTTGTLKVTKEVQGEDLTLKNLSKEFKITVKGPNNYNKSFSLPETVGDSDKTVTWTISDLPAGEYTVSESYADVNGYSCTATYSATNGAIVIVNSGASAVQNQPATDAQASQNVTVTAGDERTMTVTNTYTKNATVDLSQLIQKQLTLKKNSTLPDNTTFSVTVTPKTVNNQPATSTQPISGTVSDLGTGIKNEETGDTTYTAPFIFDSDGTLSLSAGTYTYTVQEDATSSISGMQYDSNTYTLTIAVENSVATVKYTTGEGSTSTEVSTTNPLTIKNTYQTPALTVTKQPYKVNNVDFKSGETVAHVGEQIVWKVNVTNNNTTQASTQLKDTLGDVKVYTDEALTQEVTLTSGTWTARVPANNTVTYYVTYTVKAKDIPNGKIVNTIVMKNGEKDSDPVSTWDTKQLKYATSLNTSDWTTTVTLKLPTVKQAETTVATDNNNGNPVEVQPIIAISEGSYVIDQIGNEFTFMDGLSLKVNDKELSVTQDETNKNLYHFRTETGGTDLYTVTYTAKDGDTPAQFKWEIKENIPAGTKVTLSYKLKLTNHNTAAGTYGVEDLNGNGQIEQGKTPIYTNESAVLYKDKQEIAVFPKPSVSYTIKGSSGGHGGNGGGTVTIPDDVPTGLNGKDHYAYVVGYPDGMVYPQKNITRAEVATIFFRLLTDETREANMTKSNGYNDMKDGAWYTCAVSTLSKMGIIKGYEDGSFKPDASISRAEFAAIAARFDPDGDKTPATFSDVSSHWAKDEISIAANHGWIKGYEDGSFKPDQKITRAETMTLVNRVLKRLPETKDDLHKDMKTWPDNQNESAWFYLAVQEATNSHYQKLKKDGTHETWESMRETRDWAALEK